MEQNPTVIGAFVHAKFVLMAIVHIRNISAVSRKVPGTIFNKFQIFVHITIISAVTDPILIKILGPNFFFWVLYFCGPTFILKKNFF